VNDSIIYTLYDTTFKYLVIVVSAETTDLSSSSENTPSALVILKPDASVRTVEHASSSQTWISVIGHSLRGKVADAVVQIPARLKGVHAGVNVASPEIVKTAFDGSALVMV